MELLFQFAIEWGGRTLEAITPILLVQLVVLNVFILLGAAGLFFTSQIRARARVADLVHNLDMLAAQLSEAEKIGHFGSFVWDFEYPTRSFWSEEMYNLFGLVRRRTAPSLEAVLQQTYEADREYAHEQWEEVLRHAGPFSFTCRIVSAAGRMRSVQINGKSIWRSGKELQRIKGVVHDVTREKEVDRAKSEFVSLASHQLKTPLTSIRWLSEALGKESIGPLTKEQHAYVENIQKTSRHMSVMVNDLLNLARIEMGTLVPRIQTFGVCALARSVVQEQQHAADSKGITLQLSCEWDLGEMEGDENMTRMVLQNLISNAIKYTSQGGSVECNIAREGVGGRSVFIRVSDTGIGIPKEDQKKLFEKFHRADNAETESPDGTGLGLYVVKTIVERAGGSITFESQEGKGTTFIVSIPLEWKEDSTRSMRGTDENG